MSKIDTVRMAMMQAMKEKNKERKDALSLLLAVALADEAPQTDASLIFTVQDILEAGNIAMKAICLRMD